MKKQLHLHVGLPKCASSFLQEFLVLNRAKLNEYGLDYPDGPKAKVKGNVAIFGKLTGNSSKNFWSKKDRENWDNEDPKKLFSKTITPQLIYPGTILSSEGISSKAPSLFKFLTEPFDSVKIHIVFRPKIELVESQFNQKTKRGKYKFDINSIFEQTEAMRTIKRRTEYSAIFKAWESEFGAENICAHYLSPDFPPIHQQFLQSVGVDDFSGFEIPKKQNESLSSYAILAMSSLPGSSRNLKAKRIISRVVDSLELTEKRSLISNEVFREFNALFEKDNIEFASIQDKISLSHLQKKRKEGTLTFQEMLKSKKFNRLKEALKNEGLDLNSK